MGWVGILGIALTSLIGIYLWLFSSSSLGMFHSHTFSERLVTMSAKIMVSACAALGLPIKSIIDIGFGLIDYKTEEKILYSSPEKYRRKPQLSQAPSIRSKCAWLSCGVLIISSLIVVKQEFRYLWNIYSNPILPPRPACSLIQLLNAATLDNQIMDDHICTMQC